MQSGQFAMIDVKRYLWSKWCCINPLRAGRQSASQICPDLRSSHMVDNSQKANSRVGVLPTIDLCLHVLACQDTQSATSKTSTSTTCDINPKLRQRMLRKYSTLPDSYSPLHNNVFDMLSLHVCQYLSKITKKIFNGFAA